MADLTRRDFIKTMSLATLAISMPIKTYLPPIIALLRLDMALLMVLSTKKA